MKAKNIYKELFNEENYRIAYEQIKDKPKKKTEATESKTQKGFSNNWIQETIKEMKDNSFKFKPSKRIEIPKENGKMRVLGIPSPRDKIIQRIVKNKLEEIYEKLFLNSSHGYRPNRSCHTALLEVRSWRRTSWMIEGDIRTYFDNIDPHKLERILSKNIEDTNFLNLYWKFVKAGYVESNTKTTKGEIFIGDKGIPQGGVLSPLLANIYLHELDLFIEQLKLEYDKDLQTRPYLDVEQELKRIRNKYSKSKNPETLLKLRQLKKKLFKFSIKGVKINYVRYGDDFLVGVRGTKKLAEEIRQRIKEFLQKELLLDLNLDKTKITNINKNLIMFLGYKIGASNRKAWASYRVKTTDPRTGFKYKKRASFGDVNLYLPLKRVLNRLVSKDFAIFKKNQYFGKYFGPWVNLSEEEIIMRYRSILVGLYNYYSIAKDSFKLKSIRYILIFSCAHTLAAKFKCSLKQIFGKYGKFLSLKVGKKRIDLNYEPKVVPKHYTPEDLFQVTQYSARTKFKVDQPCSICQSLDSIEIHHVRDLKDLNPKLSTFNEILAKLIRKQIPLCRKCHDLVHRGKYSGPSLKNFC